MRLEGVGKFALRFHKSIFSIALASSLLLPSEAVAKDKKENINNELYLYFIPSISFPFYMMFPIEKNFIVFGKVTIDDPKTKKEPDKIYEIAFRPLKIYDGEGNFLYNLKDEKSRREFCWYVYNSGWDSPVSNKPGWDSPVQLYKKICMK